MIAQHAVRGVTYTARILSGGLVELSANGQPVGVAELSIRIHGGPLLGGDEMSANAIYRALQAALGRLLEGEAK